MDCYHVESGEALLRVDPLLRGTRVAADTGEAYRLSDTMAGFTAGQVHIHYTARLSVLLYSAPNARAFGRPPVNACAVKTALDTKGADASARQAPHTREAREAAQQSGEGRASN